MIKTTEPLCFTEEEAADLLRISRQRIQTERRNGRIRAFRIIGADIRYTRDQLVDYLKNHPCNQSVRTGENELSPVADESEREQLTVSGAISSSQDS